MPTPEEWNVILLSLRVGILVVLLTCLPGVALGWALARWQSPWRTVVQGLVMLPLVMPPVVTGYVLLRFVGRQSVVGSLWHSLTGMHLSYSMSACVIAAAVVGFPLLVESVRLSMLGIDERLEHVSRSLGRGRLSTFFKVTLPLAFPGLLVGCILMFARSLGEFGATMVLAGNIAGETRQIPIAVFTLLQQPDADAAIVRLVVASVVLALGALFLAVWLGRVQRRRGGVA